MRNLPGRPLLLAAGIAVAMHGLLFAVSPADRRGKPASNAPRTAYLFKDRFSAGTNAIQSIRVVRSPVVFSLPSAMGFSRELAENDVQTRKEFAQQVRAESYLDVTALIRPSEERIDPARLMVHAKPADPGLPRQTPNTRDQAPVFRRINMDRDLRNRLMGPVILPEELNRPVETPWEVRATLTVSAEGLVDHVFLEKPLEPAALNQQVLQLLRELRFKSGEATEARVEVYSPETIIAEDAP